MKIKQNTLNQFDKKKIHLWFAFSSKRTDIQNMNFTFYFCAFVAIFKLSWILHCNMICIEHPLNWLVFFDFIYGYGKKYIHNLYLTF